MPGFSYWISVLSGLAVRLLSVPGATGVMAGAVSLPISCDVEGMIPSKNPVPVQNGWPAVTTPLLSLYGEVLPQ